MIKGMRKYGKSMKPANGGQGVTKSGVKTSEVKDKIATGKDLRSRPSGGGQANRV